ncbi:MAG: M23 family metallopeptidase [Clostridia bacterium]|nr:M23 family metallopeptidase [Clostridia bacterium]
MDYEFKKTSKTSLGKLGLYTLLLLGITAIGIGSYAAMKSESPAPQLPTEIDWDNQGGTVGAEKIETKITVMPTENVTESEPIAETTQATDNLPYTGSFTLPLGTEILKDYSDGEMVSSKTMGDWRIHNGIDFTGKDGSEIFAIQHGTVTDVYEDEMWGTVIVIDHGNDIVAKYCGMKKDSTVQKGDAVSKGQTVGKLGTIPIEQADGAHLHLEITVNGKNVDPLAAMNRAD